MSEALRGHETSPVLFELQGREPGELPAPERERFTPLRAGILNLWQYDEQELRFHQGRLLLRGENGTGKSKALEVLLPFLLDADLSPHRLDPFASTSRTMYWNLLEGDRHESRVGYVWLELGRLESGDDGGRPVVWTLGCGLRASRRTRRVDSWYFVTSRRVGGDLSLTTAAGVPLLKDELARTLGELGEVYDGGKDYRERVDQVLFSLGESRFAALRHLLLQLRRPQLSQKLDPASLSDLLAESLPSVDADLIGQLSEGFERLEEDEKELARVEAAGQAVEAFLTVYRRYGRGVARGRAAEVRRADSAYHRTAGEVRETEAEREAVEGELAAVAERQEAANRGVAESRGTLRALEASEAMRSAEALAAKREHAQVLKRHASEAEVSLQRAGRAVDARRREREGAETNARRGREARDVRLEAAAAAAIEARLEAAHAAAVEALAEDPGAAEGTARAAVRKRRDGVEEVAGLVRDRDVAQERWQRSEERRRDAAARLQSAAERARGLEREETREEERLVEDLAAWAAGLRELSLAEDALPWLQEVALSGEELATAVARLAAPIRDHLVREASAAEADGRALEEELRERTRERARVEAARELPPQPPRTRESDRTERPGAPLYLLVDFRDDLAEEDRAGLEAALEASGLLDAWVSPRGELLDPGTLDTMLVPSPRQRQGTLADALAPVAAAGTDPEVSREVVEALLRSIDLGGAPAVGGSEPGAHWVAADGSWRLGPLRGSWKKAAVEHVGAEAREQARRRRLAELDEEIADLEGKISEAESRRLEILERLRHLEAEVAAVPSSSGLREARHRAAAAAEEERRQRDELGRAEEASAGARRELDAAASALEGRAQDLGLADDLDDLPGLRLRLQAYEAAFARLADAAREAAGAEARERIARDLLAMAEAEVDELRQRRDEAARQAASARAELETLEATLGEAVREVVERQQKEKKRLEDLEAELNRLAGEREKLLERRARASERLDLRQEDLAARDAARGRVVERLWRLAQAGFLRLVLEPETGAEATAEPEGKDETAEEGLPASPSEWAERSEWTLTRALSLAREVERRTADVDLSDAASDRRANRLHQRYQELLAELGPDFQPSLRQEEELALVRVVHNAAEHDVPALLALLRENAETRRALLADHERNLLRGFLLGEVGHHLRSRLRHARELVEHMNELLEGCPTASGMVLRLAWRPAGEAAPEIRQAVELLQREPALLAEAERRTLEGFLLGRIGEARQRWEKVPWREHLMAALDYRRWYRFRVQRRTPADDGWLELTRHGHAAASGGEKAVALHLPLFAAAAAHYRSARPEAPRLVMLDEAFAGIDQGMRGRCMKLLVDFDLDFMMTSHDEWGCYEELPGVAVYQLYRDPALDGVGTVRFVWSGGRLQEDGGPDAG